MTVIIILVHVDLRKSISQHMDSAGLDDIWTEAGVYAVITTQTMLDGKAYYRDVRGHQLIYNALWRLRWPQVMAGWTWP